MRHYEMVVLVHPNHHKQIDNTFERYIGLIKEAGGTIHRREDWGRRPLAYPIQNQTTANYFLFNFETTIEALNEIQRLIRFNDSILRHLITQTKGAPEGDSVFLQQLRDEKRAHDERESRRFAQEKAATAPVVEAPEAPAAPAPVVEAPEAPATATALAVEAPEATAAPAPVVEVAEAPATAPAPAEESEGKDKAEE